MLYNKDYILRLLEQFGRVLAGMLDRVLHRPPSELIGVEGELQEMARRAGLDLDLAERLALDSLPILVGAEAEPDPARTWLLAELLYLRGLQLERLGDPAAGERLLRSRHLYSMVRPEWRAEVSLPEPSGRLEDLDRRLGLGTSGEGEAP